MNASHDPPPQNDSVDQNGPHHDELVVPAAGLELQAPTKPAYDSLQAALAAANGDFAAALTSMGFELEIDEQGNVTRIIDAMYVGQLDDDEFALLQQIPTLKNVWLRGAEVTDQGLISLEKMPQLTRLSLSAGNITDRGLTHLRELHDLQSLHLEGTGVTGSGLIHIPNPERVTSLDFTRSPFTNEGLKLVARFRNLEDLGLWGTRITDDGLVHLKECHKLRYLTLFETSISDRGLEHIVDLPELERLEVSDTGITDSSLDMLLKMPTLKEVTFGADQISVNTFERLQQAGISVDHGGLRDVRRENNLLRYLEMDYEVDTQRSTLRAFVQSGNPDIAWKLEIECTERYVPRHMSPAHLEGPPIGFAKPWRQLVGEEFTISYPEESLHPIRPGNPCNIYVGWHAVPNNHRIRFVSRAGNRLLVDWRCDARESEDDGGEPIWLFAEIPFAELVVSSDENITLNEAKRLASGHFDLEDFHEPEPDEYDPTTRFHFRVRASND